MIQNAYVISFDSIFKPKKKKKPFYKHGNTKMYIDIPTGIFILI